MTGVLAAVLMAIEIHATGNCPAATDIGQRMEPLLGGGTAARTADVASIRRNSDGTLTVSLADSDGRAVGDRQFPRGGTCADQAETVAVTLAIWEAQIHPEIALRLDRLSPQAASPGTPPPAPADVTTRTIDFAAAPPVRAAWSLGAAVAGDWQVGAWVPGGRVELGVGRAGGRWRARLAALGVGRHTQDVAPGQASWWRGSLSLGADCDLLRGSRWAVGLGAGAVGGVVSLDGSGFPVNRTSRSLDAGAEARARAEWRPGRVRPWLGVSMVGWVRRQAVDLQGATTSSTLPRVEPMVALGADFVW